MKLRDSPFLEAVHRLYPVAMLGMMCALVACGALIAITGCILTFGYVIPALNDGRLTLEEVRGTNNWARSLVHHTFAPEERVTVFRAPASPKSALRMGILSGMNILSRIEHTTAEGDDILEFVHSAADTLVALYAKKRQVVQPVDAGVEVVSGGVKPAHPASTPAELAPASTQDDITVYNMPPHK